MRTGPSFLPNARARSMKRCTGSAGSRRRLRCVRKRLIFSAKMKSGGAAFLQLSNTDFSGRL